MFAVTGLKAIPISCPESYFSIKPLFDIFLNFDTDLVKISG